MNKLGNIIGFIWFIAFGSFFVMNFISKEKLPSEALQYKEQFKGLLESFLSSPLFFVFFIGMSLFVMTKLAKDSGWKSLAALYSLNYSSPINNKFITGSGYVGTVSHNGVLKICADDLGIYLKTMFPFSFGYKPILIPWCDIESIKEESALIPEKSPKILKALARKVTMRTYRKLKLVQTPDQYLVIQWHEDFDRHIPSGKQNVH